MSFAVAVKNPIVASFGGNRDSQASDGGSYFYAQTPTPGTGIIGTASVQALVETTPTVVLYNAGPFSVYPMLFRSHITVIAADATPLTSAWTITMDVGNRYTSGGTVLAIDNISGNTPYGTKSGAFVAVGAIIATAKTPSRRIIGQVTSKDTVLEVVHDTMTWSWGDTLTSYAESVISNAATPAPTYANYSFAPCVIGPNCSMVIVNWGTSGTNSTASTREYYLSWVEK